MGFGLYLWIEWVLSFIYGLNGFRALFMDWMDFGFYLWVGMDYEFYLWIGFGARIWTEPILYVDWIRSPYVDWAYIICGLDSRPVCGLGLIF